MALELESVRVDKPDDVNVVVGQAHFIKTVDDLHEAIAQIAPGARFGVAFSEASGPRLVRRSGSDQEMISLAVRTARPIGAGHSFVIMLGMGEPDAHPQEQSYDEQREQEIDRKHRVAPRDDGTSLPFGLSRFVAHDPPLHAVDVPRTAVPPHALSSAASRRRGRGSAAAREERVPTARDRC
jgi:hypothetical protein